MGKTNFSFVFLKGKKLHSWFLILEIQGISPTTWSRIIINPIELEQIFNSLMGPLFKQIHVSSLWNSTYVTKCQARASPPRDHRLSLRAYTKRFRDFSCQEFDLWATLDSPTLEFWKGLMTVSSLRSRGHSHDHRLNLNNVSHFVISGISMQGTPNPPTPKLWKGLMFLISPFGLCPCDHSL